MPSKFDFINKPDLLVLTGSRLYNTARYDADGNCLSDEDYRGFVIPPLRYLLNFESFDEGTLFGDHKIWSLHKFISMLMKGNAQALECLFAPPSHIKEITSIGQAILDMRPMFVSKVFYKSITGFAYSEWRKVKGVKLVIPKKSKTEEDVEQAYRNVFNHPEDLQNQVVELMFSMHNSIEVPCRSQVGEKRRAEYDKYGYCVSGAHHALRMLYQAIELMNTGELTFPRPEAVLLSAVKRGELPFSDVQDFYDDLTLVAKEAYTKSALPEKPDSAKIWAAYETIIRGRVAREINLEVTQ